MTVTHTPGPWTLDYVERGAFQITDADEAVICHRNFWTHNADQSNANGHLITAAPEMLEALIAAFYQIAGLELASAVAENGWRWPSDAPRHVHLTAEKVRAAIAKAEGAT